MAREGTPFAGTAAALVLTPKPHGASPLSFRLWGRGVGATRGGRRRQDVSLNSYLEGKRFATWRGGRFCGILAEVPGWRDSVSIHKEG